MTILELQKISKSKVSMVGSLTDMALHEEECPRQPEKQDREREKRDI